MSIPVWLLVLVAVATASLLLATLNLSFWWIRRDDRTPLWMAVWFGASYLFTVCRGLQYLEMGEPAYNLISRVLLTSVYALPWLGYELANSLIKHRPRPWERLGVILWSLAAILVMWAGELILTHSPVLSRPSVFGDAFHWHVPGPLYAPVAFSMVLLGTIAPIRLIRSDAPQRSENLLVAAGFLVVILFNVVDGLAVVMHLARPRLTDLSYLPMGIFFTITQVSRIGRVYRDLDATVQKRTAALREANEVLRAEIGQRKQAQEALQVSEELYRMLFEANPHPAWVYDLETLEFLLVNDSAVNRYGYSRDDFLHMTILDIRPKEELPALHENLATQTEALQWSGPWTHCKKDGSRISVEILSHALAFDGRRARLVMANDITDRVRAEAALQESEEKYRTVVENANDGITIIQNGIVRYVNLRLAEMRGEPAADLIGRRFEEFVHPDERERVRERYTRRAQGLEEPTSYETALVREDGSKTLADLTIGGIAYHGKPAEIVMVRDISDRRQTEQALQRQLREMTVLNIVATAGSEARYIDELIERVTVAITQALYPDSCGVLIADYHTQTWHPHPSYRGSDPEALRSVHPFSEGIAGKSIGEVRTIRVGDVSQEPVYRQGTPGVRSELATPIIVNGRVFGCLNAESRTLNAFTEHDERLMGTIAEGMATAIEKIRLLQAEKRRREEAEILYNTTRDLVMERDLSELLHVIVERAAGMVGAPSAALYLCEPSYRQVRCAVSFNTPQDLTGMVLKYGEGAAGMVADSGQPLIIEDYRTWVGRIPLHEQERPFISVLSVPMRWQGEIIGVLHILDCTKIRSFSQDDLRMVSLFANQAAMTVENARLFKDAAQRAQEAAVIADVGRDLSETLQLDVTLERIATYAKDLFRARTCAVYLPEPATSKLRAIAALGPFADEIKADPLTLGEGILGSIAMKRAGEIVNYVDTDPRAVLIAGTEEIPVEHLMGVPVLRKDQLDGLIAVWRVGEGHEFNAGELQFLTSLAGQVGVAIENARLFGSTRRRLSEIEGMHTVSTALRAARTLDEALPIILDQLMDLLNAEAASLEVVDATTGEIVTRLAHGAWASTTGVRMPPGEGITAQVIATAQPYMKDDRSGKNGGSQPELYRNFSAVACVPVIAQHQPIGVLWIGRETPVLPEEINLLSAIGEMVGNAIHRMQLNEETVRRADEFEALYSSATSLASKWDLQILLDSVVTQTIELLHSSNSDVYLYDPEQGDLRIAAEKGASLFLGTRIRTDEGMAGRVFRDQQPLIVSDYSAWESRSPKFDTIRIGAAVEVPITFAGEKIGVLTSYETGESKRIYTEAEARLLSLFATQAASAIRMARLLDQLQSASRDLSQAYDTTLEGWARALELRDKETEGHSRRVTELTIRLARCVGIAEPELVHIRRGVLLHDIGKMGITDMLLRKTGPLSEEEWVEMRKHPLYAYELLRPITYLHPALDIPYCHHERWNGSGYPRGLKGKRIPLAARIFAVVDVYDALLYDRPYRKAWPRRKVLDYLHEQSGVSFDPDIVEAFLRMLQDKTLPRNLVNDLS